MPNDLLLSPAAVRRAAVAYLDAHPNALSVPDPVQPQSRSHMPMHWALGAFAGGQVADVLSTRAALNRGASEANPVYGDQPSLGRLVATKAAVGVPSALLLDKLYNRHPKLALSLALGLGAFSGGLAVHNSRQGRK